MKAGRPDYDRDYQAWSESLLAEGTRIRHIHYPHLTGVIKHYEWQTGTGRLSPIPYCVGWDDSRGAFDLLGMFFVYPHPDSIEALP